MIQWIVAALRLRREEERLAGKVWALSEIERDGIDVVKTRLEEGHHDTDWGRRAFDKGVIEALQEADAPR